MLLLEMLRDVASGEAVQQVDDRPHNRESRRNDDEVHQTGRHCDYPFP